MHNISYSDGYDYNSIRERGDDNRSLYLYISSVFAGGMHKYLLTLQLEQSDYKEVNPTVVATAFISKAHFLTEHTSTHSTLFKRDLDYYHDLYDLIYENITDAPFIIKTCNTAFYELTNSDTSGYDYVSASLDFCETEFYNKSQLLESSTTLFYNNTIFDNVGYLHGDYIFDVVLKIDYISSNKWRIQLNAQVGTDTSYDTTEVNKDVHITSPIECNYSTMMDIIERFVKIGCFKDRKYTIMMTEVSTSQNELVAATSKIDEIINHIHDVSASCFDNYMYVPTVKGKMFTTTINSEIMMRG